MSTSETNGENVIFSRDGQNEPSAGQWDDAELIRMFERSTAKNIVDTNNAGAVASVQQTQEVKSWKVGDSCMAPYELDGKWYPASIESIAKGKGTCKVLFSGYEERATVKMDQLMTEIDIFNYIAASASAMPMQGLWSVSYPPAAEPPKKRFRLTPNVKKEEETGGFFKVPDIPTYLLRGKKERWEYFGRENAETKWLHSKEGVAGAVDNTYRHHSPAYLRFLFKTVPKRPPPSKEELEELSGRATHVAERYSAFNSRHCSRKIEAPFTLHISDSNRSPNLMHISENGAAFGLYLEAIGEKLGLKKLESDVEYAGDNTDPGQEEFEETGDKIARDEATSADNPANGKESGSGFPLPDLCPPPPPALFGKIALASSEKDALTNMLMSWYMSGYHTGFYQGVMQEKMSNQKK